jgi:murein DD-endopeptidase MepM/ murein hydrolase activator NlpD
VAHKEPAALPTGNPVPFADVPSCRSFWPVRTADPRKRTVCYLAAAGDLFDETGRRFLALRDGGERFHVGVDLYGNAGDPVVACEDGEVFKFGDFYEGTDYLMVRHSTALIRYGEVEHGSPGRAGLRPGIGVQAGQVIARVGRLNSGSHMCHFETYARDATRGERWMTGEARPRSLRNPTRYLLHLSEHGVGIDIEAAAVLNRAKDADPEWQTRLREAREVLGAAAPTTAGDPGLACAIARWQLEHGLAEDGLLRPQTWTAALQGFGV